jgi:hypothetical protein
VSISFHVDNISLEAEDDCPVRLVQKLAVATIGLVALLEQKLKLEVAKDKTFKLASDQSVQKTLDDALPELGSSERAIKELGIVGATGQAGFFQAAVAHDEDAG